MSVQRAPDRSAFARRTAVLAAGLVVVAGAAACSGTATSPSSHSPSPAGRDSSSAIPTPDESAAPVSFGSNLPSDAEVPVSKTVRLRAAHGRFVRVRIGIGGGDQQLSGRFSRDRSVWTSTERLEPGVRYSVSTLAEGEDGDRARRHTTFRAADLTLDEQTYPSFVPRQGQTVGVGMPVIVRFDVPVTDRVSIERHLSVRSTSHQAGAWHWVSDTEVHWRPRHYWKRGTDVTVRADIDSIPAGDGVYGQLSRSVRFHVGSSVVSRVNTRRHTMKTFINGKLARTTPITTGKPGFTTRSGTKVIIEKFRHKRMNSETVGIATDSAEGYDLSDVEYAMRVTYSGEFLHAAPWSVASQGSANVSHGCTGMSTSNAAWLYARSKVGDVVEYTGTDRPMTLTNGYGDWNETFARWRQGSALR